MNWDELLKTNAEEAYRAAEGLIDLVDEDALDWKPSSGDNWMTTGQLLMHISEACGKLFKGFATGDWGMPDGVDFDDMPDEAKMPTAESMPSVSSLDEARGLLAADKKLAFDMIEEHASRLDQPTAAPWDPRPVPLGQQFLAMIGHLQNHKAQLYYYLKLQGKPVNTFHMYGMAGAA